MSHSRPMYPTSRSRTGELDVSFKTDITDVSLEMVIINHVRLNLETWLDDPYVKIPHDFASRGKPIFRPSTSLPHSMDWGATNYWTNLYHQISPGKKQKPLTISPPMNRRKEEKGSYQCLNKRNTNMYLLRPSIFWRRGQTLFSST